MKTVASLGGGGHHLGAQGGVATFSGSIPAAIGELASMGAVGFPWAGSARGRPRKGMMRRAVFSDLQRRGLEKRFQAQKYITKPDRKKLAEKLGLKDSQVREQDFFRPTLKLIPGSKMAHTSFTMNLFGYLVSLSDMKQNLRSFRGSPNHH